MSQKPLHPTRAEPPRCVPTLTEVIRPEPVSASPPRVAPAPAKLPAAFADLLDAWPASPKSASLPVSVAGARPLPLSTHLDLPLAGSKSGLAGAAETGLGPNHSVLVDAMMERVVAQVASRLKAQLPQWIEATLANHVESMSSALQAQIGPQLAESVRQAVLAELAADPSFALKALNSLKAS